MNLFKKILKILAKIILGVFAFYLLLTLCFIPLICPWIIKSQAVKCIKHEVKVRSVSFNPFLWKLKVKDFSVLDSNNKLMIGFDKFWIDVSFIGLLKKKYHVESLGLSGIKVNIVLLDDGKINILELAPKRSKSSVEGKDSYDGKFSSTKYDAAQEIVQPKPLPLIVVDLISMNDGEIFFTDKSLNPPFITKLSGITLSIIEFSTSVESEAKISFKAQLDEKAIITDEATIKPFAKPLVFDMVFKLNDYVLQGLTPYVGKYTGRKAKKGKLDVTMEYRVADNKLDAKHKILVKGFDFGDKVESKDALTLPFGMVLALLEDSNNRIKINLPVDGDMNNPDFHYFQLAGQVAKNFFFKLITKPFTALVSMVGSGSSTEDYGSIGFVPGKAELADIEKEKLKSIVKAFNDRKNIAMKVKKCYDSVVDWRAIKAEVFENEFKILGKESERQDNWVYERLYERRFGRRGFWKITKGYKSEEGSYDFVKINEEVKRQLIGDGSPDKKVLEALATQRANVVHDFIIAAGLEAERVSISDMQENQAIKGTVPVKLELKIYEDSEAEEDSLISPEVKQ